MIAFQRDIVVIAEIANMGISVCVRAGVLALGAGYDGRNANYQTAPG